MKQLRLLSLLLCVVTAALNQPIVAWAQDAAPPPAAVTAVAGLLIGKDGKSPWAGQVVRVVDPASSRLVGQATSDAEGRFTLPELAPGEYVVVVGRVVSRLSVTPERPVRELRLVVSAEHLAGEQIPLADLTLAEVTGTSVVLVMGSVLIIGGAAIGGAVAGYNLPSRTGHTLIIPSQQPPVSPSRP